MPLDQLSAKTVKDGYMQLSELEKVLLQVKNKKAKLEDKEI